MRLNSIFLFGLIAIFAFSRSVEAEPVYEPVSNSIRSDLVFLNFPLEELAKNSKCPSVGLPVEEIEFHELAVDSDDILSWDGVVFDKTNLDTILRARLVPNGLTQLLLHPSAHTKAGTVFDTLRSINKSMFPCLGLVGNEQYRQIWRPKHPFPAPWGKHPISLDSVRFPTWLSDPIQIQVVWSDANGHQLGDSDFIEPLRTGYCRAFVGTTPVNTDQLIEFATQSLKEAIDRNGGEAAIASMKLKPENIPPAIIVTTSNTPWRCIGGVVYNLQVSGFLGVGFTVFEKPNAVQKLP